MPSTQEVSYGGQRRPRPLASALRISVMCSSLTSKDPVTAPYVTSPDLRLLIGLILLVFHSAYPARAEPLHRSLVSKL